MIKKLIIIALCSFASAGLYAGEVPISLNYRSFYDQVINGDISEFTIYKDYQSDVHAVAKGAEGKTYIIDRPYKYEDDDIFMEYLKEKGVSVTILDDVYKGEVPEKNKHKNRMMWLGSVFYLIPIALIIAIVIMAKTISRQSKTIEVLSKTISNQSSDPT